MTDLEQLVGKEDVVLQNRHGDRFRGTVLSVVGDLVVMDVSATMEAGQLRAWVERWHPWPLLVTGAQLVEEDEG